ncbi:MAG: flagellar hook-length control protein FliK [Eubacterium sp.]|nr:flagellar hook-length control protein FliK [Eubacterium sp.]
MVIKMDPHSLAANAPAGNTPVSAATDGRGAEKLSAGTTDSIVKADFGNNKQQMTTGTYAEEVARQLNVKEINSDLDVMDPANFISQCMTGEDAHDLSEEGTPLEEYVASSLERALVRVKEQRAAKQDAASAEAEKIHEVEEQVREKSEEIAASAQLIAQMSQALAGSELPIRETTPGELKKAYDMANGVNSFDDASLRYLVANETAVTPKSIQDSLYGSGAAIMGKNGNEESGQSGGASAREKANNIQSEEPDTLARPDMNRPDGFDEIRPQIADRLALNKDADEKAFDTARWLYQNDLPVTGENINRIDTISELRDMDPETLLNRIVSEMEDGVFAEGADLSNLSRTEVSDLVDRLVSTDDRSLRLAYPERESLETARRRLEEIRLTMTISSAREMTKLGISIDINNLEEMVEGLRAIEKEAQDAILAETSLEPTDANRRLLTGTIDAAGAVLASPVELLSYTFESRQTVTLQSMAAEGQALAAGYGTLRGDGTDRYAGAGVAVRTDGVTGAGEIGGTEDGKTGRMPVQRELFKSLTDTYEAVGTQVRSDLGDSIRKAFKHLDGMLDELGLPKTAENERAVRILGYNRMEITAESVTEMKTYDNRVNNLMNALKPQVVKRMIEEKLNPLNMSLPELEEEVTRIRGEVDTEDIAFSRFLWKLDKQRDIAPEERESMIGIYRLLDKIEKSDGAVIGQLVGEGRELTLKNMLDATRTRRRGHVDAAISDEAGAVEITKKNTSIDAQIMSAFTVSEAPALKAALSPRSMHERSDELEDMTPEELFDLCEDSGETDAEMMPYYDEMAERVRQALEEREALGVNFFSETDIPETIRNVMSANDFVRRQMTGVRDLWTEEESGEVVDRFDEPDELDGIFEKIEKTHREALAEMKESDDISYDRIGELTRMAGHISFYHAVRRYQSYEVPLMTEQGILDCHVTVRDGRGNEKGTVEITADNDELGRLQATFKVSGTRVNGFITAEQSESIEAYQSMLSSLEQRLTENGFTTDGNRLLQGNRNSLLVGNATDGAKNQDLYKVAKCFLQSIRSR